MLSDCMYSIFLMKGIAVSGESGILLRPCLVRKKIQDSPSHRIFGHMHGALNKDKN
jgi:hypothetical protein